MTQYTADISDAVNDVKRLYVDLKIHSKCPECGEPAVLDLNEQYVSYGDVIVAFECDECMHDWDLGARVISSDITIEVDE